MKVLFDHNTTERLRPLLPGHAIHTAREMLWDRLSNGDLIRAAEEDGFEAMVTADQSIKYQQNNLKRRLPLVVLDTNNWRILKLHHAAILEALTRCRLGSYELVRVCPPKKQRLPRA